MLPPLLKRALLVASLFCMEETMPGCATVTAGSSDSGLAFQARRDAEVNEVRSMQERNSFWLELAKGLTMLNGR